MTLIKLSHVSKTFSNRCTAVDDISMEIPDGRITALLGPSGCGKTTTLKLIAGLLPPSHGDIRFDGHSVLQIPPEKRRAVMVFQNHLLFPHMTIEENIGFGLKMRGVTPSQMRQKVAQILERVHLNGLGEMKPGQLSGGQQQRAALARALITRPRVLLLDEPLSNLDAYLRDEMRELIYSIQREQGITTLFVTHDQEEAVILADQIVLMFQGTLQQAGQPHDFYEKPATLDVARFFGMQNFFPATGNGCKFVHTDMGTLQVAHDNLLKGRNMIAIRPENIQVIASERQGTNVFMGCVRSCIYLGTAARLQVEVGETMIEVLTASELAHEYREGSRVNIYLPPDKLCALAR